MTDDGFQQWLDHEWPEGAATGVEYDIDDLEAAFAAGRAEEREACARLAEQHHARYNAGYRKFRDKSPQPTWKPFAGLLRDQP